MTIRKNLTSSLRSKAQLTTWLMKTILLFSKVKHPRTSNLKRGQNSETISPIRHRLRVTRWIRFTKKGHSFSTTCFQLRTWSRSKILGLLSTKAWKGMKVRTVKKTLLWMMKMLNYIPWVDKIKWRQLKWFRCHIKIKLLKQSLSSEKSWEWNAYLLWQYLYFSLINYFSKILVIRKRSLKFIISFLHMKLFARA